MSGELITLPEVAPVATLPTTPMGLIQAALSGGAGVETIERLVALQERMIARESETAFNAALNRCQASMTRIQADATNPQTHSKYATYAAIDRVMRPIYSAEGFSISFDTADMAGENIIIIAILSHSDGHTRTYQIPMPNDGKGAKGNDVMTRTHAQGAAVSYGRRYLLCSIFNVAIGEEDKDGNTGKGMPAPELEMHLSTLELAENMADLADAYAKAYASIKAYKDNAAMNKLLATKESRKKSIGGAK